MCGRFKESHARMMQKVRDALREREDMRRRMDEAFSAKEAVRSLFSYSYSSYVRAQGLCRLFY